MTEATVRRPRTLWEEGRLPAYDVVTLSVAVLLTAVVLNRWFSGEMGLFADLVFVTICVAAALSVRPADFFTVGVLPPLSMLLVVVLLAIADPNAVARAGDGVVQATVSGLSSHSLALALGYAACLAILAFRRSVLNR